VFSEPATDSPWRARSLDRTLGRARARSVERLERLLDAARDLANETGSASFTVQQLCGRTGISLKGFYASFAGKDDLLVALLEEDSLIGATLLAEAVACEDEPVERLRAYVVGLFEMLTLPGALGYASVLVREHRRLGEHRPDELTRALAPLVDLLATEIDRIGDRPDARRDAETVFALLLDGISEVTLGRAEPRDRARYLWQFCAGGLGLEIELASATGRASTRAPARRKDRQP